MITEKLSLTEFQQIIRDSLYMALPDFYWVIAEISEIKENYAGHCYLELIEKQAEEKNATARVKAIIWNNRYRFLSSFFKDATGESIKNGMKVLVKVKIEYHELYGLSLVISDIDPSFTIGEMAMKRQLIIRKLEEDGVISMNKELEFPLLPQRIAVISSEGAAGYRDFISHLKGNIYKYVFHTELFDTVMQGTETEKSVIASLEKIAGKQGLFDVVAIIRGGGSQSDLSWFDNYNIAFYVTQFPIPVITGIGHEKDMSVTDMVANQALKTPTAVADHLIECTAGAEELLREMSERVDEITRSLIDDSRNLTEAFRMKLITLAGNIITGNKLKVERYRSDLVKSTMNLMERVKTRTEVMGSKLGILDPENVLRRGYSITTMNGKILRRSVEVKVGCRVSTKLYNGDIESNVTQVLIPPALPLKRDRLFSGEPKKGE